MKNSLPQLGQVVLFIFIQVQSKCLFCVYLIECKKKLFNNLQFVILKENYVYLCKSKLKYCIT